MPTNNFKLFDEKKANMMSDDDYAINQQRLNGVQSGVASSQLQNKTLYQTALMCYALAQLMAANGYDANDANAVSTFVNNLSLSMVQKVVDKASDNDVVNQIAGKWVDAKQLGELKTDVADNYLPLSGGTMTGDLLLNRDPVSSLQAVTKRYVDKFKFVINTYKGENSDGGIRTKKISIGFRPRFLIIAAGSLSSSVGTGGVSGYIGGSTLGDITWSDYGVSRYTLQYLDDGVIVGGCGFDSSLPDLNSSKHTYIYFAAP